MPMPGRCQVRMPVVSGAPAAFVALSLLMTAGTAAAQTIPADPSASSSPAVGQPTEPILPHNLVAPDVLQPLLRTMWRASPTFRRQCFRLGEHPDLLVRVELTVGVRDARARTQVDRRPAGRQAAVQLEWRTPAQYVEYIAHELEHVLEQLDGVDLPRLARQGVDGVMRSGSTYETVRARAIGQTVAREVNR